METTEDQRRNLEVDSIDRTQPVQFHQAWRYVMFYLIILIVELMVIVLYAMYFFLLTVFSVF